MRCLPNECWKLIIFDSSRLCLVFLHKFAACSRKTLNRHFLFFNLVNALVFANKCSVLKKVFNMFVSRTHGRALEMFAVCFGIHLFWLTFVSFFNIFFFCFPNIHQSLSFSVHTSAHDCSSLWYILTDLWELKLPYWAVPDQEMARGKNSSRWGRLQYFKFTVNSLSSKSAQYNGSSTGSPS